MALKAPAPPANSGPEWLQGLSPVPVQLQKNVEIDYDRLVCNVEHSIMVDRDRSMLDITPQELLIRSNPGVYSNESELSRDLTNPREMYNILAYKAKSNEDLAARFKQELSKSLNTPGILPKLARTVSMNEIRRNPNQFERFGNKPFQGTQRLQTADKKVDVFVLKRHRTDIGDVRKIPEEEKENLRTLNLPNITRNAASAVERDDVECRDSAQGKLGLPGLTSARVKPARTTVNKTSKLKRKLSASDSKLDKWFSEMPNEVFDKAQRAIMEESIKDKLLRYQEDRSRKVPLPNQHVNASVGSRVKRLPNTFLEVHVDSFGKHLQNEKDEKMNKYKLQQKSMLKLKMRDIETLERKEKTLDDIEMMAKLALQPRSLTTLALTKAKPQSQNVREMQPEVIKIQSGSAKRGLKTVNMNETVGFDLDAKHNSKYSASEIKGKLELVHEHINGDDDTVEDMITPPPPNSAVMQGRETEGSLIERETTKATVVTLSLRKEIPEKRKPFHIEKTILMNSTENYSKNDIKTHIAETADAYSPAEGNIGVTQTEDEGKYDKIVTKIPTARSHRTSDSKSSSSSVLSGSKSNKSALKKFNKLEVFAESSKQPEFKMLRNNYQGQKVRDLKEMRDPVPPSVRLDLKHAPHERRSLIKEDGEIVRSEVRMQDVVFRFEPGEVFITARKQNNTSHAYNNRSSERARIIYGKAVHGKDDKRDPYLRALESRDRHSSNTSMRLGPGKRIADGLTATYSSRDGEGILDKSLIKLSGSALMERNSGNKKSPHLNVKGVLVRDIATETDVIGSEPNTPREQLKPPEVAMGNSLRSTSNLSGFIVDNNDGESLESDADDEDETITDAESDKHSV